MRNIRHAKRRITSAAFALCLGLSSTALAVAATTPRESGFWVGSKCQEEQINGTNNGRSYEECVRAKCNALWPDPTPGNTTDPRPSYQTCVDVGDVGNNP